MPPACPQCPESYSADQMRENGARLLRVDQFNEADTPVVNDSSAPSTMPSAALANLTGPDTPASSRPGPSGVSPVPASKRLRGWESDEDDDEA